MNILFLDTATFTNNHRKVISMELYLATIIISASINSSVSSTSTSKQPLRTASFVQRNMTLDDYSKIQSVPVKNVLWFFTQPFDYYRVPLGSKHLYRSYADVMLGHSAQNDTEFSKMNLRMRCYLAFPGFKVVTKADSVNVKGHRVTHTLVQACSPDGFQWDFNFSGFSRGLCVPTEASNGVMKHLIAKSYDKIVWQNQSDKVVLITRYVNDAIADWKVLSMEKRLSNTTQLAILNQVRLLGLIL